MRRPAPSCTGFGEGGYVDLKQSIRGDVDGAFMLDSPPVVYRDIVITGGSNGEGSPSPGLYGDIRGWDARSGKLLWSFHTVPRAGEPGVETWEGESWKNRSGTNAWSYLTVDVERGLVFAPTGSPTSDFYGADRKGKNLYGNCLIALDAATGTLKWFQQLVHHDIWDWDLPGRADAHRRHAERPPRPGGRADHQDEPAVHLRPRDRRAALRDRGAPGAAERRAGRGRRGPRSRSRSSHRRSRERPSIRRRTSTR